MAKDMGGNKGTSGRWSAAAASALYHCLDVALAFGSKGVMRLKGSSSSFTDGVGIVRGFTNGLEEVRRDDVAAIGHGGDVEMVTL